MLLVRRCLFRRADTDLRLLCVPYSLRSDHILYIDRLHRKHTYQCVLFSSPVIQPRNLYTRRRFCVVERSSVSELCEIGFFGCLFHSKGRGCVNRNFAPRKPAVEPLTRLIFGGWCRNSPAQALFSLGDLLSSVGRSPRAAMCAIMNIHISTARIAPMRVFAPCA